MDQSGKSFENVLYDGKGFTQYEYGKVQKKNKTTVWSNMDLTVLRTLWVISFRVILEVLSLKQ